MISVVRAFSLFIAVALASGCGGAKAPVDRTLVIGLSQEPDTLDPLFHQMSASREVMGAVYAYMVERDDRWNVLARDAAARPSFKDGTWELLPGGRMRTTWRFRPEARWSDGTPVTALDAIFAQRVIMDDRVPVTTRDLERRIENMESPDSRTLVVTWKEHYAYADVAGHKLLPRHLLEPVFEKDPPKFHESDYGRRPLGDGPFILSSWEPGSRIVLAKNPAFGLDPVQADTVIFRFIPETNTLLANLLSGDLDMIGQVGITFDQALELSKRGDAKYRVEFTPGLMWEHIDFNMDDEIVREKAVRHALIHALDRQKIVDHLFEGKQPVSHGWLPPKHYGYDPGIKPYAYDSKRAEALLDGAGWTRGADGVRVKDGRRLKLTLMSTAGNKIRELVEEIIKEDWSKVGVELEIRNELAKVFFGQTTRTRQFKQLAMYAWVYDPIADGEAGWTIKNIPSKDNNWQGQNLPGWRNAEASRLAERVPQTLDEAERRKLLIEQQRLWVEDLPAIPLYFRSDVTVVRSDLQNWKPTGSMVPPSWNAHAWRLNGWAMR